MVKRIQDPVKARRQPRLAGSGLFRPRRQENERQRGRTRVRIRTRSCPLKADLEMLMGHQRGLVAALQRLRRDAQRCQVCQRYSAPRYEFTRRTARPHPSPLPGGEGVTPLPASPHSTQRHGGRGNPPLPMGEGRGEGDGMTPGWPDCPVLRQFNALVSQAIQEINDEYNLAEFYGGGADDGA